MRQILSGYVAAAALALTGCASSGYGLRPGSSTEDDVRRSMGNPAMVFDTRDGGRELVYPRGPMGNETFIARVGQGGTLQSIDQVLNDGNFDMIEPGLTEDDILRRLGPPRDSMAYSLSRTHSWDWKYMDMWGYPALFSVTFDERGIVVSKFKERLEQDRRR
ncbi:MAG TPA: hypothetical protein VFE23_10815 [Usitatibacter sp.]|jgi:hypothetical protein|nr:hypothetical protein [Usitatibacter sp.]